MYCKINSECMIQSTRLKVKTVDELIPGDIILHPIFREDGLLLVNRYSTLFQTVLKQIHVHLKAHIPVIVVEISEELNKFLSNEIYLNQDFILLLNEVVNQSSENYKIPITLESYVDNRVNLKSFRLPERDVVVNQDANKFSSLGKLISSTPLWGAYELRLESEFLQNRAKIIKNNFLNLINNDQSLLDLVDKMSSYDDLLLIHGMNATCISMLIGLTMELTDDEMIDLAISALFCNIGFIGIGKDRFYEYLGGDNYSAIANEHIKKSLEIIASSSFCRNKSIIFGILDHHEYFDGSGAPSGKGGRDISLFGRILNIVHEYDDLVSGTFGRAGMNANSAEYVIWENKEKKFDPDILKAFFYRSNIMKIGQTFIDPGNNKGTIVGFRNFIEYPVKPIVKFSDNRIIDFYDYAWTM